MQGLAVLGPPATTVDTLYRLKGLYHPSLIRLCALHAAASKPRAKVQAKVKPFPQNPRCVATHQGARIRMPTLV
jgi:hypothetical protein